MGSIDRRRFCAALGMGVTGAWAARDAGAQALPDQIRVIVPLATGSSLDSRARVIAEAISRHLGRRVIVENRPGAGGTLGAQVVARARPDGATLLFNNNSQFISPHVYPAPGFDPLRDFIPLTQAYESGMVLVGHPAIGAKTLADLIAAARAGRVEAYASSGSGGLPHLCMELLMSVTGMRLTHVPYKGDAPALVDVLAGRVPVMVSGYPAALPHVQSGALHAIAVTSLRRVGMFPDTPTLAEAGYPRATLDAWGGFHLPARTPRPLVDALYREMTAAFKQPLLEEHYASTGAFAVGSTPADFAAFCAKEWERYGKLVRALALNPA